MFFKAKKSAQTTNIQARKRAESAVITRAVADTRWIHRNQLDLGMYVNELDKPWEQTSFLFQGFEIDSYETLEAVRDACEYANVQTTKLAQIPANSVHRLVGATN